MYKICEGCGAENEINELFCIKCTHGSKFIENSELEIVNSKTILEPKFKLLKLQKEDEFCVEIKPNDIIGREAVLGNYLKNNLKISRFHTKFIFKDNSWFVQDNNSTNGTFINDIKLNNNEERIIKDNDKLRLSLDYSINIIIQ